jgi:hypothetical protein
MLAQGYVVATCPFNAQQWLGVSDIVMKIIAMSGMGNLKPSALGDESSIVDGTAAVTPSL